MEWVPLVTKQLISSDNTVADSTAVMKVTLLGSPSCSVLWGENTEPLCVSHQGRGCWAMKWPQAAFWSLLLPDRKHVSLIQFLLLCTWVYSQLAPVPLVPPSPNMTFRVVFWHRNLPYPSLLFFFFISAGENKRGRTAERGLLHQTRKDRGISGAETTRSYEPRCSKQKQNAWVMQAGV